MAKSKNNKIEWSGKTKNFIESLFGGKTIEEIKSMTSEDRKSLINAKKRPIPTTGHTTSLSARTTFDIPKQISNDKHRTISSTGNTSSVFSPKSTKKVLNSKPDTLQKKTHEFRKTLNTPHSGSTSNNTKNINAINFNLGVETNSKSIAGTIDGNNFPIGENYGFGEWVSAVEIQKDGKILVGGSLGDYYSPDYPGGYHAPYLIRLNPDGTVDDTFSVNNLNNVVYTIAIQSDGKILLGGSFNNYDGYYSPKIVRINEDGSFDETFQVGNGADNFVNDIKIQEDGKILVGGVFTTFNQQTKQYIVRLNNNGSIDPTFLCATSLNNIVNTIAIQNDGKILLGGNFTFFNGESYPHIVRMNSDGTLDTTFIVGSGFNNTVYSIDLQSDGKIIVGGGFYDSGLYNGTPCNSIVRLNTDGTLNSTFGYGFYGEVYEVKVQPDDKILAGGYMSDYFPYFANWYSFSVDYLVRFNSDTSFDYNFYYKNSLNYGVYGIAIQSDGKILIGGDFNNDGDPTNYPMNYFGRLNNTISSYKYVYSIQDNTCFNGENPRTYSMGSNTKLTENDYDDGLIVSAKINGSSSSTVIGFIILDGEYPLFTNSQPDCIFSSKVGTNCEDAIINNYLQVRADSLLDGGWDYFSVDKRYKLGDIFFVHQVFDEDEFEVRSCFKITEIITDDYFDWYEPIEYVTYNTCEECVRANGIPYYLYSYTNESYQKVISYQKLNVDFDNFFNNTTFLLTPSGYDFINFVNKSESFPNPNEYGTVPLIYGTEAIETKGDFYGTAEKLISKKGSGEFNFTFNTYNGPYKGFDGWVFGVYELRNKQIMVGGFIGYYNNEELPSYGVAKLNADGTLDKTFNPNLVNGNAWCFSEQSDGKILMGGNFEGLNGIDSYNLARVDKHGNLDVSFTNNLMKDGGLDGFVYDIKVLSTGEILICGEFYTLGNYEVNGFVKLNSDGSINKEFLETKIYPSWYSYKMEIGKNGRIFLGGAFDEVYDPTTDTNYNNQCFVKLNGNGSLDTDFNSSGIGFYNDDYNTYVTSIKTDSNGKILVGGAFNYYNGDYVGFGVIRLNPDGTWDDTFDIGNGFDYSDVNTLQVQPDNKVVVGGFFEYFDGYGGYGAPYIFRLNEDGSPDTTFLPTKFNYGFNDPVFGTSLSKDGNLVVGGWFDSYMWNNVGDGGGVVKLWVGNFIDSYKFDLCSTNESSLIYLPTTKNNVVTYQGLLVSIYKPTVGSMSNNESEMDAVFVNSPFLTSYTSSNIVNVSYSDKTGFNENYYALELDGYITVPTNNTYYFALNSDDASDAFINNIKVSDFYGLHGGYGPSSSNRYPIYLNAGTHSLKVRLQEEIGGDFVTLFYSFDDSSWESIPDSWLSYGSNKNTYKGNVDNSPSVCGNKGNAVSASTVESGSNYFSGDDYLVVSNPNDEDFLLETEDFTIEWYQYLEYNGGNPVVFAKGVDGNCDIMLWFNNSQELYLEINSQWYYFGYVYYLNSWNHFSITRKNNIIRVFKNGIKMQALNSTTDFWSGQDIIVQSSLISTNYPLTIGRDGDGNNQFYGYITNFRWIKGTCLYDSDFNVPTSPLTDVTNTKLLLLSKNQTDLILDSSSLNKTVTQGGLGPTDWELDSPFSTVDSVALYSLFNSDGNLVYDDCQSCTENEYVNVMIYGFDGLNSILATTQMKLSDVQKVLYNGPYFDTTMGGQVDSYIYSIMNYYR